MNATREELIDLGSVTQDTQSVGPVGDDGGHIGFQAGAPVM